MSNFTDTSDPVGLMESWQPLLELVVAGAVALATVGITVYNCSRSETASVDTKKKKKKRKRNKKNKKKKQGRMEGTPGNCLYTAISLTIGNQNTTQTEEDFRRIATQWLLAQGAHAVFQFGNRERLIEVVSTQQAWAGDEGDLAPVVAAFSLNLRLRIVTAGRTYVFNENGFRNVTIYHHENHFTSEPVEGVHGQGEVIIVRPKRSSNKPDDEESKLLSNDDRFVEDEKADDDDSLGEDSLNFGSPDDESMDDDDSSNDDDDAGNGGGWNFVGKTKEQKELDKQKRNEKAKRKQAIARKLGKSKELKDWAKKETQRGTMHSKGGSHEEHELERTAKEKVLRGDFEGAIEDLEEAIRVRRLNSDMDKGHENAVKYLQLTIDEINRIK